MSLDRARSQALRSLPSDPRALAQLVGRGVLTLHDLPLHQIEATAHHAGLHLEWGAEVYSIDLYDYEFRQIGPLHQIRPRYERLARADFVIHDITWDQIATWAFRFVQRLQLQSPRDGGRLQVVSRFPDFLTSVFGDPISTVYRTYQGIPLYGLERESRDIFSERLAKRLFNAYGWRWIGPPTVEGTAEEVWVLYLRHASSADHLVPPTQEAMDLASQGASKG